LIQIRNGIGIFKDGQHDEQRRKSKFPEPDDALDTAYPRQVDIHQYHVGIHLGQAGNSLFAALLVATHANPVDPLRRISSTSLTILSSSTTAMWMSLTGELPVSDMIGTRTAKLQRVITK